MSSHTDAHPDKGKGRALEPNERTPLLSGGSSSTLSASIGDLSPTPNVARRRLWSRLTYVFLASLCFCITAFAVVAFFAYSYAARASNASPDDLKKSVILRGPDRVDVLNITEDGGIWINVEGRVGIDAGSVIGVTPDDEDSIWKDIWKSVGRWGINQLHKTSVTISRLDIFSQRSAFLASIEAPPLELRLTANPPKDLNWLTKVSIPILVHPTQDNSDLLKFVQDAWRDGAIILQAYVGQASVQGGGLDEYNWRSKFQATRSNIKTTIQMQIPHLPGLPPPGRNTPFPPLSELVTLRTFNVFTEGNHLTLDAEATIIDPAPLTFNLTSPSMPFTILLPSTSLPIPVASVSTAPFSLTHPNITLFITGTVLPLPICSSSILSTFLTRYLSARSNPILISTPMLPGLTLDTLFPAPDPRPRLLRNVTIQDMTIKTTPAGTFLASGKVFARIVLPKGMNVEVEVHKVLPDVMIFDGEVPDMIELPPRRDRGTPPPLPDPLPERAFGHIRPGHWLAATSTPEEPGDEGFVVAVSARIVDVPLEVLPGRQKEFSSFVGKVIFGGSNGALAGLLGSADVAINVPGLPFNDGKSDMELYGLPFQGSVRIGKKSLFKMHV